MKTRKWIKDLGEKEVIHTPTKEIYNKVSNRLHEFGMRWCTGCTYKTKSEYSAYEGDTCLRPSMGEFSSKEFYEGRGYKIYTIDDLLDFEEFVLPKKWCIKSDGEGGTVGNYFNEQLGTDCYDFDYGYLHRYNLKGENITRKGNYAQSFHGHGIRQGYTEITFEQFKKYVLKQEDDMETRDRIITAEQAQSIINIACNGWKPKLADRWANSIVLGKEISISEEFYKGMRKACTADQNNHFDNIFGKDEPLLTLADLEIGEMMRLESGEIILRTYSNYVNIDNPRNTFATNQGRYHEGTKVESGTEFTIKAK